jgi:hypothetical protein
MDYRRTVWVVPGFEDMLLKPSWRSPAESRKRELIINPYRHATQIIQEISYVDPKLFGEFVLE